MLTDKLKILFELERYGKLIGLYRETSSAGHDPLARWYYTASLLEQKQYKEAIKEVKQGISQSPGIVDFYLLLAVAYGKLELYQDAEKACLNALNCDPDDYRCHQLIAQVYIWQDRYAEANDYLQKVLELQPGNAEALLLLARIYFYIDKEKQARLTVQKVLESSPNDPEALSLLADFTQKRVPKTFLLKKALLGAPTEKSYQKKYNAETGNRRRAIVWGLLFSVGLVAYSYFVPSSFQKAWLPVSRFFIITIFVYYSRYYLLTVSLSLLVTIPACYLNGEIFRSGWSTDKISYNLSMLASLVILTLLAVLIAGLLRGVLALPLLWGQDKWKQYRKQKQAGQGQISLAKILTKPLSWYYITGAFGVPLANCIGYYMAPHIFWTILTASVLVVAIALLFLAGIKNIVIVIISSLFYAFCSIILTIFCSAVLDGQPILTIPVVFLATLAATLIALNYATTQRESILLKKKASLRQ